MSAPRAVLDAIKILEDYLQSVQEPRPIPPTPTNTIAPPYGVLVTMMTIWGLNYDGSDDHGDIDGNGNPQKGAWGAETHNKDIIGCALPIKLLQATFGGLEPSHIKGYTVEIYSEVTHKTVHAVDIVDEGPAAWTHRGIDGTYALHQALGHLDYGEANYGSFSKWPAGFHVSYWINDAAGKPVEIKGWDFHKGRVIGS